MKIKREDIFTPANALTIVGLVLSVHGATHINSMGGTLEYGAGRLLDLADGFVARRTHISRFGAIFDAGSDKVAIAAILIGAWQFHVVPVSIILVIAFYNILNAIANTYAHRHGADPETSKSGKHYMFGYNLSLGSFALGNTLSHNSGLEMAGWVLFAGTIPVATKASYNYIKHAWHAKYS